MRLGMRTRSESEMNSGAEKPKVFQRKLIVGARRRVNEDIYCTPEGAREGTDLIRLLSLSSARRFEER